MKKIFDIGIVTGVHGVRGGLKVFPYSNDPVNLSRQEYFLINGKEFKVSEARVQGKFLIVQFKGIDNRDDAESMKNSILSLPREKASPLGEGEYYMEDLIGCSVYEDGNLLGKLEDILETGANDVYSVIDDKGREILIPALKHVILKVEIDKKVIEVRLPEGLVDDEYI